MARWRLNGGLWVKVLEVDYQRMKASGFCWYVQRAGRKMYGYVVGERMVRGRRIRVYLHRWIMNAPPGSQVRWKNGRHLDCWRRNLVVVPCRPRRKRDGEAMRVLRSAAAGDAVGRAADAQESEVL